MKWKKFGMSVQPNKQTRRDWRCRDPFSGKVGQWVFVAVRIKEGKCAPDDMDGLEADHNMDHSNWKTLDWTKILFLPKGTDPSRGGCKHRD